ncbi:Uncharacterised protein [Klebsiella pneumoniae]|nr:Uncharacterised protein [Klebsiella pneumoniae]
MSSTPEQQKGLAKSDKFNIDNINAGLKDVQSQRQDIQNAMGGAVVAVASKEISRNLQSGLKKIDDQFTKDAASLSKSAKDYRDRSDAISNDKSLSKDEKSSQLEKLNADRQKGLVDATQKRLDGYQNLVKTLQDQKASVESQLKSESLTAEQKKTLDTKNIALSKQINDLNNNQVQMAQADLCKKIDVW